jgi:hypothetical protein
MFFMQGTDVKIMMGQKERTIDALVILGFCRLVNAQLISAHLSDKNLSNFDQIFHHLYRAW